MNLKGVFTNRAWRAAFAACIVVGVISLAGISRLSSGRAASAVADVDLTGVWKGDDGATYYIRHVKGIGPLSQLFGGDENVFWFGQGQGFGNVFHGKVSKEKPEEISGAWVDVPVGAAKNKGMLALFIASPDRLVLKGEPGNFAAREWKRVK